MLVAFRMPNVHNMHFKLVSCENVPGFHTSCIMGEMCTAAAVVHTSHDGYSIGYYLTHGQRGTYERALARAACAPGRTQFTALDEILKLDLIDCKHTSKNVVGATCETLETASAPQQCTC